MSLENRFQSAVHKFDINKNPGEKQNKKEPKIKGKESGVKERFQQLANIKNEKK